MFRMHFSLFLYTLVIAQTLVGSCVASFAASVSSATFVNRDTLAITFSGPMGTGVTTPANYLVSGAGAGDRTNPISVTVSGTDPDTYILTWTSGDFGFGQMLTLTVDDSVQDSGGAALVDPKTADVAIPLGQWEFISGTGDYVNEPADYTDGGNGFNPGSRRMGATSTDNQGNLWLFGGTSESVGVLNDLWKFNIVAGAWEFVSGTNDNVNEASVYTDGGNGVHPGSRYYVNSWTDADGNFWMFGGYGYAGSIANPGFLNDLWMYNVTTEEWRFVSGTDDNLNEYGDYTDDGNGFYPGSRYGAQTWTDATGNFWLFGGRGYGESGTGSYLNDLWKFDIGTEEWIFVSGTNDYIYEANDLVDDANGVNPGSRVTPSGCTDQQGNLWLFGGDGYTPGLLATLNDLWKFDVTAGEWEFISGTGDYIDELGDYTDGGDGFYPGSRYNNNNWTDSEGNLWLFGGYGYGLTTDGYLNDLWKYDTSAGTWTQMSGIGGSVNQYGSYTDTGAGLYPGSRLSSHSWTDKHGDLWLFGGRGYADSPAGLNNLNDLWKYNFFAEPIPPAHIAALTYVSVNELQITFSAPMGTGVTDAMNYAISGAGAGSRAGVAPDSVTNLGGNAYLLTWSSGSFTAGSPLTLTVDPAVEDATGEPIGTPNSMILMVPAPGSSCNCSTP